MRYGCLNITLSHLVAYVDFVNTLNLPFLETTENLYIFTFKGRNFKPCKIYRLRNLSENLYESLVPLITLVKEMAAQIAVVMLAGYETTSTALGFTAYELALNPHVQIKLQEEIDQYFPAKVRCKSTQISQLVRNVQDDF